MDFPDSHNNESGEHGNEETGFSPNTSDIPMFGIMESGCVRNFETVACIRSSVLSSLAIITGILCAVKLARLQLAMHPSCHQYVIFYAAGMECVVGGINWIFWNVSQLDFVMHYIKLLQVLLMCHFYITLAMRALRKEIWADRFMYPFLFIAVLYFTIITSLGIFYTESAFVECLAPYWLALSSAEVVVVQMFFVSGFYITRRLNEISTLDSVRWAQKRDLWCIVIVFEMSALVTFVYDLALQILGDRERGCGAIFADQQEVYSPLLVSFMVLKLLLPIWVMLLVFQPTTANKDGEDVMPGYSDDGTYGSIFSEDLAYRQLYQPGENFSYTSPTSTPSLSPCMLDACMPFAYTNPGLVRSSSLQPIAEENGELNEEEIVKKKKTKKTKHSKSNSTKDTTPKKARGKLRGKHAARPKQPQLATGDIV